MNFLVAALILQALTTSARGSDGANLPRFSGETLQGRIFSFPEDLPPQPTWVVVGFTKNSRHATAACAKRLEADYPGQGWSIAELQGLPFFLKGIVTGSIRTDLPASSRPRFVVLYEGREELQRVAAFDAAHEDDAYILGVEGRKNGGRGVAFAQHGNCDDAHYPKIREKIDALLGHRAP